MLEKLKEYKELIAIIVFFLGGIGWLDSQFPTKSDLNRQIGSLSCLVDKYMTLTQLQIRSQELDKQMRDLVTKISRAGPGDSHGDAPPLSPAMKLELDQMNSDLRVTRTDLRKTDDDMKKIVDDLGRQVCGKVNI